jgi:hypothetical protein
VQSAQKFDENEGPPRPKAPKMTESVKGQVVFWKGHDPNLTVLLMLKHATRFGRIANILLHMKTGDGVSSFMEFETAESAKKFVSSNAGKFKISTRYSEITTKDRKILVNIFLKVSILDEMFIFLSYRMKFQIFIVQHSNGVGTNRKSFTVGQMSRNSTNVSTFPF